MVRALGSARPEESDAVRRVSQAMTAIITSAMHAGCGVGAGPGGGAGR